MAAILGFTAYHALAKLYRLVFEESATSAGAPSPGHLAPVPSLESGPAPPPFAAFSTEKDFDFTKINTKFTPGAWYQSSWYGSGSKSRPPVSTSSVWGFQSPAGPLSESIVDLHNWTMMSAWFILGLVFFLFGAALHRFWLLIWFPSEEPDVLFRRAYLLTRRFSHSTWLESGWTALPPLVIVSMLVPTFGFLYVSETNSVADVTAKAIGHQWYWSYENVDDSIGQLPVESYGLSDQDLRRGQVRLLEVDHRLHLPSPGVSQVLVTSQDVVHSWALPAAGAKVDAIPGRLNQLLFSLEVPGIYFGQCSELCGVSHSQMPIGVLAESSAWDLTHPVPFRRRYLIEWFIPVVHFCHTHYLALRAWGLHSQGW